ncbi:hypothetical protein L596_014263 [Steinernema carpocapsae]|uniref:Uncharacterized protein n=1 Tax=Steinernema carpocapsae TaxID=34508 RepID=A0A4U5NCD3_STECR|nr:hypothetical protein L596_014263 [Steinernema carpocapsae]
MSWSIYGTFQCYPTEQSCQVTCSTGMCYFADYCNDNLNGYFCSSYNPFLYLIGGITISLLILVCCCACVGYLAFRNFRQSRQRDEQVHYVSSQHAQFPSQYYYSNPPSYASQPRYVPRRQTNV